MKLTRRMFSGESDNWRIRAFLRETLRANQYRQLNWDIVRWDYWYHFGNPCLEHLDLTQKVFIWEDEAGEIAAVLNPESLGEVYLQLRGDVRHTALEDEMVQLAEEHLVGQSEGKPRLAIWTAEDDTRRRDYLRERGYKMGEWPEHQRRRSLNDPIPEGKPAEGYSVRALTGPDDIPARSWVSWRAFHPNEPDENYRSDAWYSTIQRCPLYRRDLDLVVVTSLGEMTSFCTVWFDDVNRTAVFEPVGTSPDYLKKGLGKAVMCEGLRRAKELGALEAYVASYSMRAGALYASVGFTQFKLLEGWEKVF